MPKICVFGDSVVWGVKDTKEGGWVHRLKMYLMKDGFYWKVHNLGFSEDNTSKLLDRFENECKHRKPEIIILAIGKNDTAHNRTSEEVGISIIKFEENLGKLLKTAKSFTDKVIFVGLARVKGTKDNYFDWNDKVSYDNDNLIKYDDILRSFCKENNVQYILTRDILEESDLADGLHPNSEGHRKIFEKIKRELDL